ncbi:hypothetical protein HYH03_013888 [Edaphochlamys debaryana]|uniref:Uncharacterized protein n=1 Tax=Edaphochlamys debaryana TaxID=47281 RepID=A0A836BSG5_9CHLO|nr:hypothetical protein HYH03_013888 [Edaphochlamys debaryana]|eukprot:KAG2487466.1 hypothetical protein HYH03_013888 [Edaphochlamys debaryana]
MTGREKPSGSARPPLFSVLSNADILRLILKKAYPGVSDSPGFRLLCKEARNAFDSTRTHFCIGGKNVAFLTHSEVLAALRGLLQRGFRPSAVMLGRCGDEVRAELIEPVLEELRNAALTDRKPLPLIDVTIATVPKLTPSVATALATVAPGLTRLRVDVANECGMASACETLAVALGPGGQGGQPKPLLPALKRLKVVTPDRPGGVLPAPLVASLVGASQLRELCLMSSSSQRYSETDIAALARLSQLQSLHLLTTRCEPALVSPMVDALGQLTALTRLHLGDLPDPLLSPLAFTSLPLLADLGFHRARLEVQGLDQLRSLTKLYVDHLVLPGGTPFGCSLPCSTSSMALTSSSSDLILAGSTAQHIILSGSSSSLGGYGNGPTNSGSNSGSGSGSGSGSASGPGSGAATPCPVIVASTSGNRTGTPTLNSTTNGYNGNGNGNGSGGTTNNGNNRSPPRRWPLPPNLVELGLWPTQPLELLAALDAPASLACVTDKDGSGELALRLLPRKHISAEGELMVSGEQALVAALQFLAGRTERLHIVCEPPRSQRWMQPVPDAARAAAAADPDQGLAGSLPLVQAPRPGSGLLPDHGPWLAGLRGVGLLSLTLWGVDLSAADFRSMGAAMPQLLELTLYRCGLPTHALVLVAGLPALREVSLDVSHWWPRPRPNAAARTSSLTSGGGGSYPPPGFPPPGLGQAPGPYLAGGGGAGAQGNEEEEGEGVPPVAIGALVSLFHQANERILIRLLGCGAEGFEGFVAELQEAMDDAGQDIGFLLWEP